jgi:CRISPR-associated protein Csd2
MNNTIENRYDFVLFFDVKNGNPNGDPDAGNLPRLDPETGKGLVTDVCLKRKIRNYVGLVKEEQPPYEIYVKEKAVLNHQHERAYLSLGLKVSGAEGKRKGKSEDVPQARAWMCQNFFDVRTFGAVMSTGINAGQVRGPVQMTFANSIDPIVTLEHTITRMAVTTEAEAAKQEGDNRTMGRKFTVPYALYRTHGFISAPLAQQTGFSADDLELLWQALQEMFEHDRSAARGEMNTVGLYIFRHESKLGNAPARKLFERITAKQKNKETPARDFSDYKITVNESDWPNGVALLRF